MKIRNKLGTFIFPEGTILSRAKLVADSVMGHAFWPRGQPIRTVRDAYEYIRNSDLSDVEFELIPARVSRDTN